MFAKGALEDAGFAWHVNGKVHGYSTNTVATQTPAAGTKLLDTGAPVVDVTLTRGKYEETGQPEDLAPYVGTDVVPANPAPVADPVAPAARRPSLRPRRSRRRRRRRRSRRRLRSRRSTGHEARVQAQAQVEACGQEAGAGREAPAGTSSSPAPGRSRSTSCR